jgi:hypothetical protein
MIDSKLALLEHVTYIDKNVLKIANIEGDILRIDTNVNLNSVLKDFDETAIQNLRNYGDKIIEGAYITGNQWADIIEGLQNDKELSNLVVLGKEKIETSDHRKYNLSIAYQDVKTNQCIVSYKGTSGKEEWKDNVTGLIVSDTQSQKEALAFFDKYASKFDDIVVTGHSKGANKAMYVTIASKNADKISKCVAFDGQGFSNEFIKKYSKQIAAYAEKITNYFAQNDFVNVLMKQVEGSNQIPCEQFGITNPAQFHSPNSIFVRDANGNIPIDEKGNKVFSFNKLKERNENMALINKFISYVMDNTSKKELDNIVKYISPIVGEAL